MEKILLLALLVVAVVGASASAGNYEGVENAASRKSFLNYLRYIPFFHASKKANKGSSPGILKVENDPCDVDDQDCDPQDTYLVCYPNTTTAVSSCQCVGLDRVIDDVYSELSPEERAWADAAKAITQTLKASPDTSFNKATGKCTGNSGTVCAFTPLPTTGLSSGAKSYIEMINNFKCSPGLTCQQYSKENAHLGLCRPAQPKSAEEESLLVTPVKETPRRTQISEERKRIGNFKPCERSSTDTPIEECDTYSTYLACFYGQCQCIGAKYILSREEYSASDSMYPDPMALAQIEAVRHVMKYLNATLDSSYDSTLDECSVGLNSLCLVSPFPREGLQPVVQKVMDSANKLQCACGLNCKTYGGPDPYIGTCQPAAK